MEELLRQARSRFSGQVQLGSSRERKTSSFRERGPQKWIKRQLSRQMSTKEPFEEAEYAAAVAAATFAVSSLDSESAFDLRRPDTGQQFSLPRIVRRIVEAVTSEPVYEPERIRDEYKPEEHIPEKTIHQVPPTKRTPTMPKRRPTFAKELFEDTSIPSNYIEKTPTSDKGEFEDTKRMKPIESFTKRTPSMKKTPSFGKEQINKQEISDAIPFPTAPISPSPAVPPLNIQPTIPPKGRQSQRSAMKNTDADEWEREELEKVKARYEKLNATILEWEDKKKKKARHKYETTENEPEKRKTKALQNYQIEMERIKEISDGARAQAKEKRRNEEYKVKEKANKYRQTGIPPKNPVCLCL